MASFLKFQFIKEYFPKIDLSFFTGFLGYLVLGYYLSIKQFNWSRFILSGVYITCGTATALLTFYLSIKQQKYDPTFYNYLTPNTIICTAAILLLGKQICNTKSGDLPIWVSLVDRYSFGIYLVHIIPLNYLHPFCMTYLHSSLAVPIVTLLTVVSSMVIIYILRILPGGKYISG